MLILKCKKQIKFRYLKKETIPVKLSGNNYNAVPKTQQPIPQVITLKNEINFKNIRGKFDNKVAIITENCLRMICGKLGLKLIWFGVQ